MLAASRISLAQIFQTAILVGAVGCVSCNGDDDGGPPLPPADPNPAIASVEILPAQVSVPQGTSFTARARVRDKWGDILPDDRASVVRWSSSSEITVVAGPSATVVVKASVTTPLPVDVYLIASVDGVEKSDTSTISIVAPSGDGNRDWVASEYSPNSQPSFAFVSGPTSYGEPSDRTNELMPFVNEGQLPPFQCASAGSSCGVIALFAPWRAHSLASVEWTPHCDLAAFVAGATLPTTCSAITPTIPTPLKPPPVVTVAVWRVADAPGIADQIKADIAYAHSVFDQPYTGISLNFQEHPYGNTHTSISHSSTCTLSDGTTPISADLATSGVKYDPKTITVIYVDALNPGTGDDLGFTCPYDDSGGTGTLILISANGITSSTLAHELGHALGQWRDGDRTHPDAPAPQLPGFDPSNLMWSSETDWYVSLRHNLTFGQIFQMNMANISFLKKAQLSSAAGTGLVCPPDAASSSPCPPLAQDQRR
ncbi:MAG TPA: hypothetical protein VJ852_11235 [Gemmatimonadaceae bacterium]|nr:hypothetical protein [Gemmatimonadaceae bacterium]